MLQTEIILGENFEWKLMIAHWQIRLVQGGFWHTIINRWLCNNSKFKSRRISIKWFFIIFNRSLLFKFQRFIKTPAIRLFSRVENLPKNLHYYFNQFVLTHFCFAGWKPWSSTMAWIWQRLLVLFTNLVVRGSIKTY